jgi:hypothetical protein
MVTIGDAIRDILLSDSVVTALVSDKISPLKVAQTDTYPAIVYVTVSTVPTECWGDKSKLDQIRIQMSAFSKFYEQAFEIDQAVRNVLDQFDGEKQGYELYISYQGSRDLFDETGKVYHRAADYKIIARY